MKPAHLNITGRQGSSFDKTFRIHTLNLAGYKARMTMTQPNGEPWRELSTEGPSPAITLHTDATTVGQVTTYLTTMTISIDDETMAGYPSRMYPYDIELESPSGKTYPLLEGKFTVGPQRKAATA